MRISRVLFLIIAMFPCLFMVRCVKEAAPALPVVFTSQVSSITASSANAGGEIHSLWVTSYGVCWSLSQNPTISGSHATGVLKSGKFSCPITGLNPETRYYVKAYAVNNAGISYGAEVMFSTLASGQLPVVTTVAVTGISTTAAISGGNVLNQGSSAVTDRGVCYSTTQSPTILDLTTSDGTGTGIFTSSLSALTPNTVYFVRAFATNSSGTNYGSQEQFTTLAETGNPTVTTGDANQITQTSATAGGEVTLQGSSTVTARGICWSKSKNPTTGDSHTTDGTGTGGYNSSMTGLTSGTLYYFRAYATNSSGTGYGAEKNFTTLGSASGVPCPGMPSVTDIRDGKVYPTVQIGTQCWLQKNLNAGTRIDASRAQNPADLEKYCYNDLEANCETYGGLYQWDEMMQGAATPGVQCLFRPY